jgi:hypothetical protein
VGTGKLFIGASFADKRVPEPLIPGLKVIANEVKPHPVVLEDIEQLEDIADVAPETRRIIDHDDVERARLLLGEREEVLQPLPAEQRFTALLLIPPDTLFYDDPALFSGAFSAVPDLIRYRRPLLTRGRVSSVKSATLGYFADNLSIVFLWHDGIGSTGRPPCQTPGKSVCRN